MTEEIFEAGQEYFTRKGERIELVAKTQDGKFVCLRMVALEGWNGETEYTTGDLTVEGELFTKPPRRVVDAEIEAARATLEDLRKQSLEARREVTEAERDIQTRLKALEKYKGLERLEQFINGQITHFVEPGYHKYDIWPLEHYEDEYDKKGVPLISLYGNSKGDLSFRVNHYRDGSGSSWREIIPCASMEEASEKRATRITEDMHASYEAYKEKKAGGFYSTVKAALKYGVPVPDEMLAIFKDIDAANLAKQRADLEAQIKERQDKLATLSPNT